MDGHYSQKELDKALNLKQTGLTWPVVAERLGRDILQLQVMIYRYRHGQLKFKRDRAEQYVAQAEAGIPVSQIAACFQMSAPAVHSVLHRLGIDREMLALYLEDGPMKRNYLMKRIRCNNCGCFISVTGAPCLRCYDKTRRYTSVKPILA